MRKTPLQNPIASFISSGIKTIKQRVLNSESWRWRGRGKKRPIQPEPTSAKTPAKEENLSIEDLKNAMERSTSANRNFFISFLIILLYLMIIVGSTSDYQLLIPNSKVKLPFVDVEVSLILFYILAPIIVLAGHFNLLQNLESHHHKLLAWQAAYPGKQVPRALIEPFLYDYALLENDGQLTKAVRFFSRVLFLFLAPIVLLTFLWRFTDYQSLSITLWHLVLLIVDMGILVFFQRAIVGRWRISKLGLLITLLALFESLLLGFILKTQTTNNWQFGQNMEDYETIFSLVLPRISIDHTESLTLDDKPLRTQMAFDGEVDFAKWFNQQKDNGWDLRKRNLKGAQLERADLRHVLLNEAQLQGARLINAQLQGASLFRAQLQGANLDFAQLQGASLVEAQLQGASLFRAQLQGARLINAQLQGARLFRAQLQGANLDFAQLQGASLVEAQLQGASLFRAQLQGARLINAQLQGARLDFAQLQGARLDFAQLKGTVLDGVFKVQSAIGIDITTDVDWEKLRHLNINEQYSQAIDQAMQRVKNFKPPKASHFIHDDQALAQALPEICKRDYLALQGSLENATRESAKIVWAQLPSVAECQPHLEKIKQWGLTWGGYGEEERKIYIPEAWPKIKPNQATEKPVSNKTKQTEYR
ncbi:MAG: pentapeptide repeat-containing protein [Methylophilaceae bacterium]|nr:pentapeptide repeat-containing protein [Methylophilaceae bacterium]